REISPLSLHDALPISEDPAVVKRLAADWVTCEVCPSSNVALGVAASPAQVPLRRLVEAGVPVALGADDPLLFGTRLTAQYEIARDRKSTRLNSSHRTI